MFWLAGSVQGKIGCIFQGNVNVTVNVFNKGETDDELVDKFQTEFMYNVPSDYYILLELTSGMTNTK